MNAPTTGFVPEPNPQADALGNAPVPAAPYYEAEWFEAEREAVFTWPEGNAWLADRLAESVGRAAAPAGESPPHGSGGPAGPGGAVFPNVARS